MLRLHGRRHAAAASGRSTQAHLMVLRTSVKPHTVCVVAQLDTRKHTKHASRSRIDRHTHKLSLHRVWCKHNHAARCRGRTDGQTGRTDRQDGQTDGRTDSLALRNTAVTDWSQEQRLPQPGPSVSSPARHTLSGGLA